MSAPIYPFLFFRHRTLAQVGIVERREPTEAAEFWVRTRLVRPPQDEPPVPPRAA